MTNALFTRARLPQPRQGRHSVAQGVSPGSGGGPHPAFGTPLPPGGRGDGGEGAVCRPTACAVGYTLPPAPRAEFFAFCLLLAAFCFPVSAGADDLASAQALLEAGHWKRARALVEPRAAANPNDARAAWLLSRIKLAFGDLEGALKLAQQAVGLEDGNSDYHFQLGVVYGEMASRASIFAAGGLARKFKAEVEASLARDPKNLDALEALMEYSFQAPGLMGGDKTKAHAIADQLVQLSPARGYLAQAELAGEAKDQAEVEESLRKAAGADSRNYEAQTALAGFLAQPARRNTEEAGRHAREAVKLDPARAKGYSILAKVLALERRWSELEAVLGTSEKNVWDDLTPYYEAANALVESGVELQRSETYARKYVGQEPEGEEPDRAHAHRLLGLILEKRGRKSEAVAELETAVRLNPRFKEAKDDLHRLK